MTSVKASDFIAVVKDGTSDRNPTDVKIDSVTTIDGNPLIGGETMIRLYLTFFGDVTNGDTIEIKPTSQAIFDKTGNPTEESATTGKKVLNTPLGFSWDEATNTISIRGLTIRDNWSSDTVQLITADHRVSVNAAIFQTTPTYIGGKDSTISISAGLDQAEFWNVGDGLYADVVANNKIQLRLMADGNGLGNDTIMRQDHLLLTIQDASNPAKSITLDLNIDSKRTDPISINL